MSEPALPSTNPTQPLSPTGNAGWIGQLPQWFAAIAGIVYATGFLIDFSFLNSLGVKETVTDFFKAQYIYVGLLCLLFPASVFIVTIRYLRVRAPNDTDRSSRSGFFLILTLFFSFYLLIAFSTPGLLETKKLWIFILFCCNMTGVLMAHDLEDFLNERRLWKFFKKMINFPNSFWEVSRYTLLFCSFVLVVVVFWDIWGLLWDMLKAGAWIYIALLMDAGYILLRAFKAIAAGKLRVISFCNATMFVYLSVIVFAYRVYPYIPVGKGGGDYSRGERIAILHFGPDHLVDSIPPFIIETSVKVAAIKPDQPLAPTKLQSKPVVIITETADSVYFVVPEVPDNAKKLREELARWRLPGQDNKPKEIFCVKRDLIDAVTYMAQP